MNQLEIQEIAERIAPRERKIIERLKKLSIEEIFVRRKRQLYNDIVLFIIVMFFILQLPLKVFFVAIQKYTYDSASMMFIIVLFQQALLVFGIALVVFFYCYLLDYLLDLHYFRKAKEIAKKLRGDNGIQSKKH